MNRDTSSSLLRTAAMICAGSLLAGCATQPTEEMGHARTAISESVRTAGTSSPDLQRAQQKIALSQRWVDAKDYGPARWLAEQAEVDAELATARASSRDARLVLAQRDPARLAMLKTSEKSK
jgi:hypothetical protein